MRSEVDLQKDGSLGIRVLCYLSVANILIFLALSVYGGLRDYSFWYDELYSVSAAQLPFSEMLALIFHDYHPPLYQLVLYLWGTLFGLSEFSARFLSFGFAVGAIAVFYQFRKLIRPAPFWIDFCIFTASGPLSYYAQEARNYSMLIFLSAVTLLWFLKEQWGRLLLGCLLLGLTHYFGILAAGWILIWMFFRGLGGDYKLTAGSVVVGLIILAWPASQVLLGDVSDSLGGDFWIKSSPEEAIPQLMEYVFGYLHLAIRVPVLRLGLPWATIGVLGIVLFLALAYNAFRSRKASEDDPRRVQFKVAFVFFAVLATVIAVNFHSPISTPRNFLVLLPYAPLLIGFLLVPRPSAHLSRVALIVTIIAVGYSTYESSVRLLVAKVVPAQEWRGSAEYAVNRQRVTGGQLYFYFFEHVGRQQLREDWESILHNFYFPDDTPARALWPDDLQRLNTGDLLVFNSPMCNDMREGEVNEVSRRLTDAGIPHEPVFLPQSSICKAGVIEIR